MGKRGVLLVNLGSPDSTAVGDVRRYLREFLGDARVLDTPYLVRMAVLNLFILPFRPKRSAEAYKKIWTEEGSPLIATSRRLAAALAPRIDEPVVLGMRYGRPSIRSALGELLEQGVTEVFLIPLYPHFAMSSYETVVAKVQEDLRALAPQATLTVQPPFYDDPDYIEALYASAAPQLEGGYDHVLFSFHGIPERHLKVRDPSGCYCLQASHCCEMPNPAHATCYRAQCYATTRRLVERAGLPDGKWSLSFQSRLGRDPWLRPYTDKTVERLGQQGVKRLLVICPAFVSDCLETLEEIQVEGKHLFEAAGGETFAQIPCLNEHPRWVDVLVKFVEGSRSGWMASPMPGVRAELPAPQG